jgi:hypothetical protein
MRALLNVSDAFALQSEFMELEAAVDKIKRCAENPTDPATKSRYRSDPAYKQSILDRIERTRLELKWNTVAMFVGLLNSQLSSYATTAHKGFVVLSYIVGPLTSWSKNSLKQLNTRLLADLKASIAKCVAGYRVEKTLTFSEANARVTITYSGVKCGTIGGTWVIDSVGALTAYGGTGAISGPVVVEMDEETSTGTVDGTARFSARTGDTEGRFSGRARIVPNPPTLELTVTEGHGNGYNFGFLDTGFQTPGTLLLPITTIDEGEGCEGYP